MPGDRCDAPPGLQGGGVRQRPSGALSGDVGHIHDEQNEHQDFGGDDERCTRANEEGGIRISPLGLGERH